MALPVKGAPLPSALQAGVHSLMAACRTARMGLLLLPERTSRIAVSSANAGEVVKVLWWSRVGRTGGHGGC